jgi:uncharacterized protein (DUF1501 family)
MRDVMVLTMSEFGRTVRENGNRGTDHGHGTAMFVWAAVQGRHGATAVARAGARAAARGRDLAVTTDFRSLFAEVAVRHLGTPADPLFPGFKTSAIRRVGRSSLPRTCAGLQDPPVEPLPRRGV